MSALTIKLAGHRNILFQTFISLYCVRDMCFDIVKCTSIHRFAKCKTMQNFIRIFRRKIKKVRHKKDQA